MSYSLNVALLPNAHPVLNVANAQREAVAVPMPMEQGLQIAVRAQPAQQAVQPRDYVLSERQITIMSAGLNSALQAGAALPGRSPTAQRVVQCGFRTIVDIYSRFMRSRAAIGGVGILCAGGLLTLIIANALN